MKTRKKSLRILITEKCNLDCSYCCNKLERVKKKFKYKTISEIDFSQYSAVSITGGEPMLNCRALGYVKSKCNAMKIPVYLYTNGLLLWDTFVFSDFKGITIGIHREWQMKQILNEIPNILSKKKIRFSVEDIHRDEYLPNIPDKYIKTFVMNDCFKQFDSEDIIVLKEL